MIWQSIRTFYKPPYPIMLSWNILRRRFREVAVLWAGAPWFWNRILMRSDYGPRNTSKYIVLAKMSSKKKKGSSNGPFQIAHQTLTEHHSTCLLGRWNADFAQSRSVYTAYSQYLSWRSALPCPKNVIQKRRVWTCS